MGGRLSPAFVALLFLAAPAAILFAASPAAAYPDITVTSPTCGSAFKPGDTVQINWTSTQTSGRVTIELYIGWSPTVLAENITDTGTYAWTIPLNQTNASEAEIDVSDAQTTYIYGSSDYFVIAAGADPAAVTVSEPNASSVWEGGQTYNISWQAPPSVGPFVRIESSSVSFLSPTTVVANTSNNGSYAWTLPNDQSAATTNFIRVTSLSNMSLFGQSVCFETTPRVPPGNITVTNPAGGEVFQYGQAVQILWTTAGVAGPFVAIAIDFSYFTGGDVITANTSNNGTFWWTVPSSITPRTNYYVRITDLNDTGIFDQSNVFTVQAPPPPGTITLSSPTSGATWPVGSTQTVTWASTGTVGSAVKITLERHTFGYVFPPEVLADSAPNTGSFTWSIPANHAYGVQYIRVQSVSTPSVLGDSGDFQIVEAPPPGTLAVTDPAAGAVLDPGNEYPIRWHIDGALGATVRIEVGMAGGPLTLVDDAAPNSGEYAWTVTSVRTAASNYSVRVTSVEFPKAFGQSGQFTITSGGLGGNITVTKPAQGDVLPAGALTQIGWTSRGNVGTMVRIEVVRVGSLVPIVLASSARNKNTFDWSPTRDVTASGAYVVRITSLSDPSIKGESKTFTVAADAPSEETPASVTPTNPVAGLLLPLAAAGVGLAAIAGVAVLLVRRKRALQLASEIPPEFPADSAPAGPLQPPPGFAPAYSSAAAPYGYPSAQPFGVQSAYPAYGQAPPAASTYAPAPLPRAPAAPAPLAAPATWPCPQCGKPVVQDQPKCGWCGLDMVW